MGNAPSIFPIFRFFFIIFAVCIMNSGVSKSDGYQTAKTEYDKRRSVLLQKLETLKDYG